MPVLSQTCPFCSYPGAWRAPTTCQNHGEMERLKCPASPASGNRWPEGIRQFGLPELQPDLPERIEDAAPLPGVPVGSDAELTTRGATRAVILTLRASHRP